MGPNNDVQPGPPATPAASADQHAEPAEQGAPVSKWATQAAAAATAGRLVLAAARGDAASVALLKVLTVPLAKGAAKVGAGLGAGMTIGWLLGRRT